MRIHSIPAFRSKLIFMLLAVLGLGRGASASENSRPKNAIGSLQIGERVAHCPSYLQFAGVHNLDELQRSLNFGDIFNKIKTSKSNEARVTITAQTGTISAYETGAPHFIRIDFGRDLITKRMVFKITGQNMPPEGYIVSTPQRVQELVHFVYTRSGEAKHVFMEKTKPEPIINQPDDIQL